MFKKIRPIIVLIQLIVTFFLFQGCQPITGKSIKSQPENHLIAGEWSKRGISLVNSERYDEAIKAFTKALEINPRDADSYYNRGYAWKMKGDRRRALADFKEALKLMPKNRRVKVTISILEEEIMLEETGKGYFIKRRKNPKKK